MKEPSDSWRKPVVTRGGYLVTGGAARTARIAHVGGIQELLDEMARRATELAAKNRMKG